MKKLVIATIALATIACAPREWLLPKVGIDPPALRDFPADFTPPLSNETNQPMVGFGGNGGGVHRTPVIFVHGNTVSARYWLPVREYFKKAGYTDDELWALGYGWDNVRYFDSVEGSVPSLERIVTSVMDYLSKKTGRPIRQVDLIGHSLGGGLTFAWMQQTNSWHKIRNSIHANSSGFKGTWVGWSDPRGAQRAPSHEFYPGNPFLRQMAAHGGAPGPTRYMSLFDGTGWADVFYPHPLEDASIEGHYNVAYNREHGTWFDHLELPRQPETMDVMLEFLKGAPEPLPEAEPPQIVRDGDTLHASQEGALLHCSTGRNYPTRLTPGVTEVALGELTLHTCYARNPKTELSSPMARFLATLGPRKDQPLTLSASPAGGVFEQPVNVSLTASDPQAFIVYTTAGTPPNSGSPLYDEPVFIAAPVKMQAIAIAPDGRVSEPLSLDFDISLEKVESMHTLQRQFDPSTPEQYEGKRKVGK